MQKSKVRNWKAFDKYRIIRADQSATDQSKHSTIQAFKKLNQNKPIMMSDADVSILNMQTFNTNEVLVPAGSELVAHGKSFEVIEAKKIDEVVLDESPKKPGRPPKTDK
jgi:hypothetical protein